MSNPILTHPLLGPIRGVRKQDAVVQYLGLQYATLKDRFSRGVLVDEHERVGKTIDATMFGPTPLIPKNACEMEHKLFQKSLPTTKLEMSDTECLTLNITAPAESELSCLPVLVFVHGGGFNTGSSDFPHYDFSRLIVMSVEKTRTPIIAVAVKYRVGAPGFLTSPVMRQAGYSPNNGLHDQRLALQWIRTNIAGFGGDPDNVTFLGESAGAASGCFHLHQPEPLFHRLVSMSGTSLLRPRPLELVETAFTKIADIFGAGDETPEEQLTRLLNVPADAFVRGVGRKFNLGPVVDGDIIPAMTSYEILSSIAQTKKLFLGLQRCPSVLIGDCEMDGMIWGLRLANRSDIFPQTLAKCLSQSLDETDSSLTNSILDAYSIEPAVATNSTESTRHVLNLGHDLTFGLPALHFANALSRCGSRVFQYHFNCPMPWEGGWSGVAIHGQDLIWSLQNYREHLGSGQQEAAELLALHLIAFCHGDRPYEGESMQGAMVYNIASDTLKNSSEFFADMLDHRSQRRLSLLDRVEPAVLDKILDGWHGFMSA